MGRRKRKWVPPIKRTTGTKTAYTPSPPKHTAAPKMATAGTPSFVRAATMHGDHEIDYARVLDYTDLLPAEAQETYREAVYAVAEKGVTHSWKALDHPAHAMDFMLVWVNTPQGHDYWQRLCAELEDSPLPYFTT